jgi:hypothetical protein
MEDRCLKIPKPEIRFADDDHYTWESGKRSADGLLLPSITVARVGKHNNRRP